jgi:hypothetical protein
MEQLVTFAPKASCGRSKRISEPTGVPFSPSHALLRTQAGVHRTTKTAAEAVVYAERLPLRNHLFRQKLSEFAWIGNGSVTGKILANVNGRLIANRRHLQKRMVFFA